MAVRRKISLVLADVDGTLVTEQKVLTRRAQSAVKALQDASIRFAVTSGADIEAQMIGFACVEQQDGKRYQASEIRTEEFLFRVAGTCHDAAPAPSNPEISQLRTGRSRIRHDTEANKIVAVRSSTMLNERRISME